MGIRRREYDLVVRQEPKQARMCGVGTKGVQDSFFFLLSSIFYVLFCDLFCCSVLPFFCVSVSAHSYFDSIQYLGIACKTPSRYRIIFSPIFYSILAPPLRTLLVSELINSTIVDLLFVLRQRFDFKLRFTVLYLITPYPTHPFYYSITSHILPFDY